MMKKIKFYPNHEDNMHCSQAVFRSLWEYFFNEELSWEEIDKMTKTISGKGSWTMAFYIELVKRGVEVVNIEEFGYQRYFDEGEEYLKEFFTKEALKWNLDKSNLLSVKDDIPEFLRLVKHEGRRATVEDIDDLLDRGFLV